MSSPLIDLNLLPDPPNSGPFAATTTTGTLLSPKVEPKLEPLNESLLQPTQYPQQDQPFSDLTPQALINIHFTQETPAPFDITGSAPETSSPVYINSTPAPGVDSNGSAEVYSEFNRVSELFRSAFAAAAAEGSSYDDTTEMTDPDAMAIVPALAASPENSQLTVSSRSRNYRQFRRSAELVRVTDLGPDDQRYYRDVVRRTRMLYDALRVLAGRVRGNFVAASLLRNHGLWLNRDKRIVGSIPGIYVGDIFFYRMELCVLGLHGQTQAGIDYLTAKESANGEPIATSIIVSGGYEDDEDSGDILIYTGHGGQDKFNRQCQHQKPECGNLALERSMHYGIEVRVIRGIKYYGSGINCVYVYDGLYRILDCWFDVGKSGFGVFKYKLSRIEGQAQMGSMILKFAKSVKTRPLTVRPSGYLSLDLSNRNEGVPVFVFNDVDGDNDPMFYEYLARTVFPPFVHHQSMNGGTGCSCASSSSCGEDCFCIVKNGGEFPYDLNGFLVRGKPVLFECGAHCKCPPTCHNRVSQKGLRHRLEIFRSTETGWGVRSLDLIQAGTFICEYVGIVLTRVQAQIFTMNGDTNKLVYPSRFTPKWEEWGNISQIFPDYVHPTYPSIPPLDFAMDVSKMRNVACYISHSCTPNLMVQNVLYDHNNISFPHLMLFALENIQPLTELSLDYGVADEWSGKPLLLHE